MRAYAEAARRRARDEPQSPTQREGDQQAEQGAGGQDGFMPLPIEQYALVGDTQSAALIGLDGSIDWLCLPRFDSPACFTALLGDESHGHWKIAPLMAGYRTQRRYQGDTLILETEFSTPTGRVRLIDFMPPRDRRADVIRRLEGLAGEVTMMMEFVIRFDYGGIIPWVRRVTEANGRQSLVAIAGPDAVCLSGDVTPHRADHRHRTTFTVRRGQVVDFSMTWYPSHQARPARVNVDEQLERTRKFWEDWVDACRYSGPYRSQVTRSLLTLKALIYEPTGGIVAAPTTSLPEKLGGARNWDYRFCWLRDASLTLWALLTTGYRREARAWRDWLLRAVAGDPEDIQIMYGIAGERRLEERNLSWLPGYQGTHPVRVGNAAYTQFQVDTYGETLEALEESRESGIAESDFSWRLQLALVANLEKHWNQADNGIWEVRGDRRHFTHSRVMSWVAFDRAVRACERHGLPGPVQRWRELRDTIHAEVTEYGFNRRLGTFTQYYGGETTDASLLLLPQFGFLPGDDPRMVGTIAAVERELRDGPLVSRYRTEPVHAGQTLDGLPPGEGAFLACSFWLARAYALAGRLQQGIALFEELLDMANDVGLYAEEIDPATGRMTGNFPQAFSHLALVNAAYTLERVAAGRREGTQDVCGFESEPGQEPANR